VVREGTTQGYRLLAVDTEEGRAQTTMIAVVVLEQLFPGGIGEEVDGVLCDRQLPPVADYGAHDGVAVLPLPEITENVVRLPGVGEGAKRRRIVQTGNSERQRETVQLCWVALQLDEPDGAIVWQRVVDIVVWRLSGVYGVVITVIHNGGGMREYQLLQQDGWSEDA